MSKATNVYDAWCDGSFRDSHNRGGAGWVIRHNGEIQEGLLPIPKLDKTYRPHGADIAEMTAVACALKLIPDNAVVILRLDSTALLQWLKEGVISTAKKADVTPLHDQFAQAQERLSVMERLELIQITGRKNELHNRAHELSREASTTPRNER